MLDATLQFSSSAIAPYCTTLRTNNQIKTNYCCYSVTFTFFPTKCPKVDTVMKQTCSVRSLHHLDIAFFNA